MIFTSYWFYGDLEIVLSKHHQGLNYIINNYMNLFCVNQNVFEVYFTYCQFESLIMPYTICPLLKVKSERRANINFSKEHIYNKLSKELFILVYVDTSKICAYNYVGRWHQIMIRDYDLETGIVTFCDNDFTGKYNCNLSCNVSEIIEAYDSIQQSGKSTNEWEDKIYYIETTDYTQCEIQLDKIITSLKSYLRVDSFFAPLGDPLYDEYGGINIYEGLINEFELPYNQWTQRLHMGAYAVLFDHKSVLSLATELFCKEHDLDPIYIEKCNSLKEEMRIILLLVLKYRMTRNLKTRDIICDKLNNMRITEEAFLRDYIAALEKIYYKQTKNAERQSHIADGS